MQTVLPFILMYVIPITCVIFVAVAIYYASDYNGEIERTCRDVKSFSDNMEESLKELGTFSREEEGMIVRGELTTNNINDVIWQDAIAIKLNWYAHTRCYYFSDPQEKRESMMGTTEDWLRRLLKASLGE